MSMLGGRVPPGREEVGEVVATYPTYEAAQKAVSTLIAGEVPAKDIAIVGQGLRSIERITGRLGYAAAARSGAVTGLMLGLLFSFIFVLGNPSVSILTFVGVLLVGVAIGMLLNLITYAAVRRRRDFASVMQVVADSYELCVLPASIHKARELLGPRTTVAAPPRREPDIDSAPPRYGERIGAPRPTPPAAVPPRPAPPASEAAPEGPAAPGSPSASETPSAPETPDRAGENPPPASSTDERA
jgi:hypothetical protein